MTIRYLHGLTVTVVLTATLQAAPAFSPRTCESDYLAKAGVRCGTVAVAEDPLKPDRQINLNVVIVPALHPKPGDPPMFHFEGGPGISATQAAGFYAGPGSLYRESRDVVLVDQRGTGGSNPLHCPAIENRSPLQDEFVAEDVITCREELAAKADLANYSTMRAAEDIDSVREALHAEQIDIWSISYGTRLAQEYIKRFPARIRRAVMAGFAPLDYKTPLFHAINAQRVLDLLLYKCRADETCSGKSKSQRGMGRAANKTGSFLRSGDMEREAGIACSRPVHRSGARVFRNSSRPARISSDRACRLRR